MEVFMGRLEEISNWVMNMHHEEEWGGTGEIVFWIIVILGYVGLVAYAAWRLAEKHTEATGSSVMVIQKVDAALPTVSSGGAVKFSPTVTNRKSRKPQGFLGKVFR